MKFVFGGTFATMLLGAGWVAAQAPAPPTTPGPASTSPIYSAPSAPAPPAPGVTGSPYESANNAFGYQPEGPQIWGSADYLLWRIQNTRAPGLISATPAGVLSVTPLNTFVPPVGLAPGTGLAIISASSTASTALSDPGEHSGGRLSAGFWCDPDQTVGGEVSGFWVEKRTSSFASTTGSASNSFTADTGFSQSTFVVNLGPPITTSLLQANPVVLTGNTNSTVTGSLATELWGGEINARSNCLYIGGFRFGGPAGFRYLNFTEEFNVTNVVTLSDLTANGPPVAVPPVGTPLNSLAFGTHDSIITHNNFYGGQVGADIQAVYQGFFCSARAKIGVGVMHETVNIDSQTQVTAPTTVAGLGAGVNFAGAASGPGGLLASPSDVGSHHRDRIAWVPEVNLKVGYNFCSWLRGYVGYDWLYASNVARPTDQTAVNTLSTNVQIANTTSPISVSQPAFRFHDSSIFAQDLTLGLQLSY